MKTLRFAAALSAACLTFSGIGVLPVGADTCLKAEAQEEKTLRGDVNLDGVVNYKDADL